MNKMLPDPGTWEEYVETFKAGKGERKKTVPFYFLTQVLTTDQLLSRYLYPSRSFKEVNAFHFYLLTVLFHLAQSSSFDEF